MRVQMVALATGLVSLFASPVWALDNEKTAKSLTKGEFAEAQTILARFAEDYSRDHMAIDVTFGIKLDDKFWTVAVERKESASARGRLTDHAFGPHAVKLSNGFPSKPTWYFEIADMNVLRMMASGQINAGTAAMQSFASDEVGVETRDMEGFKSTSGDEADLYLVLSHFFTKGIPEVTRFGRDTSLETHGAMATSLHTMKGFRVAFFSIGPQEVANADPQLSSGQMPNLFIVTSGKGTLLTDDGPMVLEKGMSVFVPQFVKHEMINDGDTPLEGVLVLYGDNSDFAFGTSYPAFMQDLNQFYREYPFGKPQPPSVSQQ
jgi:mannose-6-phosphate isomerase-like protein (cupin superfamily)